MCKTDQQIRSLQERIGYQFASPTLLRRALTHASATGTAHRSYERLEFLGDAVVGLVVAHTLFEGPQQYDEGEMSELKSAVVSRRSLAKVGCRLGLEDALRVGKGLSLKQSRPYSLVADAYEALVGAIFLDGGLPQARAFVLRTIGPELKTAVQRRHPANFKSILQQLVQADGGGPPTYETVTKTGPEHALQFQAVVRVLGKQAGVGWGRSKKIAEQAAAEQGLANLYTGWSERVPPSEPGPVTEGPGRLPHG